LENKNLAGIYKKKPIAAVISTTMGFIDDLEEKLPPDL